MSKKRGNNYIVQNDGTVLIELHRRNGKESLYTIIDKEDLDRVINYPYTWFSVYRKNIDGFYAMVTNAGEHTTMLLHQFIMRDENSIIDHINNDSLDNRKCNLRPISISSNGTNRKSKNINNKSGYRNVCKLGNRWIVQLQINGRNTNLGSFSLDKLNEAGKFAEEMRQKYYGEYAGKS